MSIATAIQNAQGKVADCYTAISNKGGTLPATQNLSNMQTAINSIPSGGGGGGGFNLEYVFTMVGSDSHMTLTLNETASHPLSTPYGQQNWIYSRVVIPNITKVKVDSSDNGYWGESTIEFTSGGSTRRPDKGETITLTQDAKLLIVQADCLLKGTSITMANGILKEISIIKVGDKVLSLNPETGEKEEDEVIYSDGTEKKYAESYDLWEFENGYAVRTTHHHRFYNVERQAFVYLDEFNIGEHTINERGEQIELQRHTNIVCQARHFTIATKNWNNYFANGILCGNRLSKEVHLGTDEQKQVQSNPSESIGVFLGE